MPGLALSGANIAMPWSAIAGGMLAGEPSVAAGIEGLTPCGGHAVP